MSTSLLNLDDSRTRIAAVLGIGFAASKVLESFGLPHLTPAQVEAIAALGVSLAVLGINHGIKRNTEAVVTAGETAATHAANAALAAATVAAAQAVGVAPTPDPERVLPPLSAQEEFHRVVDSIDVERKP